MPATNISRSTTRLSDDQVARYRQEGFLICDQPLLETASFDRLKDHFEGLLQQWLADPRMRSPEHMDVPHFMHPSLFEWLLDDAVLDLIEPIIGSDIALFSSHFICKPAGTGKRVPWHEDSAYWKGRLDPMQVVTVWLAIDPSTPANGCMRVIPGSHTDGFSEYDPVHGPAVFDREIRKGVVDESKAVDCVLEPNHCSLHDGKLIHGSTANTGAMRRCGYTMRYIPTSVKLIEDRNETFQIYLARGKDKAGNRYGDPGKPNTAWLEAHKDGFPAGH